MEKYTKVIWFKGTVMIQCSIKDVEKSIINIGKHFTDVVRFMSGITSVELIEQGTDFVVIKTNEGLMKRTNISLINEEDKITIQFDEEYKAGKMITTNTHFLEEFKIKDNGVIQHIEISNLKAPGFLGFFYKNFGSKNIGNAILNSNKKHLEKLKSE